MEKGALRSYMLVGLGFKKKHLKTLIYLQIYFKANIKLTVLFIVLQNYSFKMLLKSPVGADIA